MSTHLGPSSLTFEAHIRADGSSEQDLVVLGKPLLVRPVMFAVRKGDPLAALLPKINQAIRARKQAIGKIVSGK